MSENIPVSIGELWDKYTILIIKKEKILNEDKLAHVSLELELLHTFMNKYTAYETSSLYVELLATNQKLWDIEDRLRIKENNKDFNNEFIELARSVYYTNDTRAHIKKQINEIFGSVIHEVKEYIEYK
jgi:DNA-dependent RNA polymerase auxiliary subunit epsilon